MNEHVRSAMHGRYSQPRELLNIAWGFVSLIAITCMMIWSITAITYHIERNNYRLWQQRLRHEKQQQEPEDLLPREIRQYLVER